MTDAFFPPKLQCLFQPKRLKVLYGGRGAGRSWGVARALLLMGTDKAIRVLCAREFQNSITESVHKLLSDQINILGLDSFYEIQNSKIIGANGTTFSFEGIKNNTSRIKSYEGVDYCWVEEAAKVSRNSWGILIPTIRRPGSEIWMTFNPELETDYTYTRFVKDRGENAIDLGDGSWENSHAVVMKMNWRDNPFFPVELRDEMERDRKRDYDFYLNVWEGFCLRMLEGVVYARELRKAEEDGRICVVPYSQEVPVDTFWDLGRTDYTSIWFAQRVAMQYRILAYYQANGTTIDPEDPTGGINHFIKEIQRRPYIYGTHFLPHDAKAKRLGTKRSVEEMLRAGLGPKSVSVVPKLSKMDGINAARIVFPNCYFDEQKCADGLNALRHYRYKVVEGQYSNEPLHDGEGYSDGADAFRYLALSIGNKRQNPANAILEKMSRAVDNARSVFNSGDRGGSGGGNWMN